MKQFFHGFQKMDKGCMISALKTVSLSVLLLFCYSFAGQKTETKAMNNSFIVGPAYPMGNTEAPTLPVTNLKKLHNGWDAGWTFSGKPFFENALSGVCTSVLLIDMSYSYDL